MRPIPDFIFKYFPAAHFCFGYKILKISPIKKFCLSAFIAVHIKAGYAAFLGPVCYYATSFLIFSSSSAACSWSLMRS